MTPYETQKWQVVTDPVAYHHHWRDSQAALKGNRRSAVNALLVSQHGLTVPDVSGEAAQVRRLIAEWSYLGLASTLLAMAKQSRSALAHPDFLRASGALTRFLHLGFKQADPPACAAMGGAELRAWGAGYVMAGLAPSLPRWVAERIPLQFERLSPVTGVAPDTFDHDCFWSALRHAQTITPAGCV